MARFGSVQFSFPEFSGTTRRLVLWNLLAFFALLLIQLAKPDLAALLVEKLALRPELFPMRGFWQPFTYSFVHLGVVATAFELLSLWFLCGFLEAMHNSRWLMGLYAVSVLGSAVTAVLIAFVGFKLGNPPPFVVLFGCMGGIFGMLVAIGVLHGDVQFQLMFVIGIKAKYLAIIYALVALAEIFAAQSLYAFAQLGGAAAALAYVRYAPAGRGRRGSGIGFKVSEWWYGLRNEYFRWKRRRAASKFQVYMKKQGRTVRFDGQGRLIDEDDVKHDDRQRWN